jgi:glutathionyl-hydroquinone reductase
MRVDVEKLFDEASGDIAVGNLEAAVTKYESCVDADPQFFDGWHALGMTLMKLGKYSEAIEAGLRSIELRPNDQLAWSSLSLFYVRNNQITEADWRLFTTLVRFDAVYVGHFKCNLRQIVDYPNL